MLRTLLRAGEDLYAYLVYPTPTLAMLYVVGAMSLLALLVLHLWHEQSRRSTVWLFLTASLVPVVMVCSLISLRGMHGVPDERCHLYDNGSLRLELISPPIPLATRPDAPLSDNVILTLVVRSQARWGGSPHTCVIPMDHPKARALMKMLAQVPTEELHERIRSWNYLIFSFGAEEHDPNFRWSRPPQVPNKDKGEPDKPPREFES